MQSSVVKVAHAVPRAYPVGMCTEPSARNETLLLGCHLSIAKGLAAAVDAAVDLGNTALQIFTHSPSTWQMRSLPVEDVERFRRRRETSGVRYLAVHAMYLVNLASPQETLYQRSIDAMIDEVRRAALLGADALVVHVGHRMGLSQADAARRVSSALERILWETCEAESAMPVLLENTAGAGTAYGSTFEELAQVLSLVGSPARVGVCLDTCHATAAGYDLSTDQAVDRALDRFDRTIGLERLSLVHLNDARHPIGSHRDRHEHLGRGTMGLEGIRAVVSHDALRRLPFVLETPKTFDNDTEADPTNLSTVRVLRAQVDRSRACAR